MLEFILGGAGCGKTAWMTEQLRKAAAEHRRILIIVPEQSSFICDTRLYEAMGPVLFNRIKTYSFTSLSEEILSLWGGKPETCASETEKTILLQQAIALCRKRKSLNFYEQQAKDPSFLETLQKQITGLRRAGTDTANLLLHIQGSDRLSAKCMDLMQIFSAYTTLLEQNGLRDSLSEIDEAAALANGSGFFSDAWVYLDEFESFTGDQYAMLEAILPDAHKTSVLLRTEEPDAPPFSLFDPVNHTLRCLKAMAERCQIQTKHLLLTERHRFQSKTLSHLSACIERGGSPMTETDGLHILETADAYREVECTAAAIRQLVMKEGYHYREIAIVTNRLPDYATLMEAACKQYDIPVMIDLRRSVAGGALPSLLFHALELAGQREFQTQAMLSYAKSPLLRLPCNETALLENFCFTWSVEGAMWHSPFPAVDTAAEKAEQLRILLTEPLNRLRQRCTDASGPEICKALYQLLEETEVPQNLTALAEAMEAEGEAQHAADLRLLWDLCMDALDALAKLLPHPIPLKEFTELLRTVFQQMQYANPPQTLDAVTLADAATVRLDAPKAVFVLGVCDSWFPSEIHQDSLFTDLEQAVLAQEGVTLSRSTRELLADERLIVYKTLSSASHSLFLSYPRQDTSGSDCFPSPVIAQIRALFPNLKLVYDHELPLSFLASTKQSAYELMIQLSKESREERSAIRLSLQDDPVLTARLQRVLEAAGQNTDHRLHPSVSESLFGSPLSLSASRIERYRLCPFLFFCQDGLKLRIPAKIDCTSQTQGLLVHFCLQRLLQRVGDGTRLESLSDTELESEVKVLSSEFLETQLGGNFGKSPRFYQLYAQYQAQLLPLLHSIRAELQQSQFRPVGLEIPIGKTGAPILLKEDGMSIRLSGYVDRADLWEQDGKRALRILDYKTGNLSFSLGLLHYGLDMQMLLYLFALTSEQGKYAGAVPAGVLYLPCGLPEYRDNRLKLESTEEYYKKQYRMRGLLRADEEILSAMEPAKEGRYLPIDYLKNGTLSTRGNNWLTPEHFDRLRGYLHQQITDLAASVYRGEISANPLEQDAKGTPPCQWCGYHDICGVTPNTPIRPCSKKEGTEAMLGFLHEEGREA